jgi:tetratricopeptide (TPR) repeat protein
MRTSIAWSVVTLVAIHSVQIAASNMPQGQLAKLQLQKSYRDVTIDRLEKWLDAVERHKPGEADASVGEIKPWGPQEVDELLIDLNTLLVLMRNERATMFFHVSNSLRRPIPVLYTGPQVDRLRIRAQNEKIRNDENRILKRGALLHTDIAAQLPFAARSLRGEPPARSQRLMVYFDDGRRLGFENAAEHWRAARLLLDQVRPKDSRNDKPAPARDEIVQSWYRVTIAYQQRIQQYELGHLERALELFPDDAELNFFNGCMHETFASRRIQSVFHAVSLPKGVTFNIGSERSELRLAEASFRRALERGTDLAEARIRLGHVLGLVSRHSDAADELRRAISSTDDQLLLYYGQLLLGGELDALGNRDRARDAYERAAALFPRAQSPKLALSQIANRAGDRRAALDAIRLVLGPPVDEFDRADPWWTYHIEQGRSAGEQLAKLRAAMFLVEARR